MRSLKQLLLLLACGIETQVFASNAKLINDKPYNSVHVGTRKKISMIRGLSRHDDLFGYKGTQEHERVDREENSARNMESRNLGDNFARFKMGRKPKRKGMHDSSSGANGNSIIRSFHDELPHEGYYSSDESVSDQLPVEQITAQPTKSQANTLAPSAGFEPTKTPIQPTFHPTAELPPQFPTPELALNPTPTSPSISQPTLSMPPTFEQNPNQPVLAPSAASEVACQVDGSGSFGATVGSWQYVDFLYQMELFPGLEIEDAINQVEQELIYQLLPRVLPQICSSKENLITDTTSALLANYTGVQADPQDTLASGFECVGSYLKPCVVIRGWVTVFYMGKSDETVKTEITHYIYETLDSGVIEQNTIDIGKVVPLRASESASERNIFNPSDSISEDSNINVGFKHTMPTSGPGPDETKKAPMRAFSQSETTLSERHDSNVRADFRGPNGAPTAQQQRSVSRDVPERSVNLVFLWWGWLAILIGILLLWGVKAAVDVTMKRNTNARKKGDAA